MERPLGAGRDGRMGTGVLLEREVLGSGVWQGVGVHAVRSLSATEVFLSSHFVE